MTTAISPIISDDIALDRRSRELRKMIVRTIEAGKRGHVGAAFSVMEILRVLYDDILRYDAQNPRWPERDRCILSKGHGCIALYVMLAEKGFFPEAELWKFCASDGILGGHPEYGKVPGVEASTGSLGHGLSFGVGFALNAKLTGEKHRVFVIVGDGECSEGSVWEAALCAAQHKLSQLTVLIDYNKQQTYGTIAEVQGLEPLADKWSSFGFAVREVNGHDVDALRDVLKQTPFHSNKPGALICHTVKGKGTSVTERNLSWHHKAKVSETEVAALFASLDNE
ncbi:MAG: transketolase [Verrucomicrobiota bacterium]|jgi:transketolase